MLLTRRLAAQLIDIAIIVTATMGIWFLWSEYSYLSALSWWYDSTHYLRTRTIAPKPDYDLATLPWQVGGPRVFELNQDGLTMVTGAEPFGYQAYATVKTGGAAIADLEFKADLASGGVTIGLQQAGKWIAANSSQRAGAFSDFNSARLGYGRSVTVVIANDNPAGESRLTVKSLRLFFRK